MLSNKEVLKAKLQNFLLFNKFLRKIRISQKRIFPILFKFFLIAIVFIIGALFSLKVLKPHYLEKIYQKSYYYFAKYLHLDDKNFSYINISGNNRVKKEEIIAIIEEAKNGLDKSKSDDYQPLIKKLILEIKKKSPWVDKVTIVRNMPNILEISITEYEPFAIWQNDGKKYITDKDGNIVLLDNIEEFKDLVILSGDGANSHAKSLFNIFVIDPELSDNVYSATWIGNRRWDIRFENGLLIKLPETNISEAWQRLIKIYNMSGSIVGLNMIDLRIEGKIYLEYGDSVIKEIKIL